MLRLADVDPLVVRRLVRVVERVGDVLAGLGIVGAKLLCADADGAAPNRRVVEVDDDLVAVAGALLVDQGAQDAGGHHDGGVVIAKGLGRNSRGGALLAEGAGDAAACCPADCVIARRVSELAELAVAAHLRPDQARELLGEGGVVQTQLLEGAGAHVVHEDVSLADHFLGDCDALGGFEVKGDPVLVGVVEVDRRVFGVGELTAKAGALGALSIAGEGLDLDDLCAHLGKDPYRCGSRNIGAHLDDLDACEGTVPVEFFGDAHVSVLLPAYLLIDLIGKVGA